LRDEIEIGHEPAIHALMAVVPVFHSSGRN